MGRATPGSRGPTLRDVANAAGVSIWTASNTFSNPDRVAEGTRQRVHDAAQALGYAGPNPGARSLALGRSHLVALVGQGDAAPLVGDAAAALVAHGVASVCDRAGLSLVLAGREGAGMMDGRVCLRGGPGPEARGPSVVVDAEAPGVPCVRADVEGAVRELATLLIGHGHREVAVVGGDESDPRLRAATGALAGVSLTVYRTPGGRWPSRDHGEAAGRAALGAHPRPTAVLALADTLAWGVMEAAHRMGLRVPHDVSVAGIDDLPGSEGRGLTTAFMPYRPMGELAGNALVAMIAAAPPPAMPVIPVPVVIRRSLGPASTDP